MTMRRTWHKLECAKNHSTDKEKQQQQKRHNRQTNKQRALTSLQLVYSCVFTCFRFAATLNMLLCLLFCTFVSLFQSSSVFPRIHFSHVREFLVIVHTAHFCIAKKGLLRCCLYTMVQCRASRCCEHTCSPINKYATKEVGLETSQCEVQQKRWCDTLPGDA